MKVKKGIVTDDDFGLVMPVNEAIEVTHCTRVLSVTSVRVGASAAVETVEGASLSPADGPPFPDMARGDEAGPPE
jgi:hypothetical protein